MRPTEEITLSREYIARDPRTGLPIAVAKPRKSVKKAKVETGPWVALSDDDVFSMLRGQTDSASVRWKDETISLGTKYDIRALGPFHAARRHQAHRFLTESLESDTPETRIDAL